MLALELEQYLKEKRVAYEKDNRNKYLVKTTYLLLTIKCKEETAIITFRPNSRECNQNVLVGIQICYNALRDIKEDVEHKVYE